MQILATEMYKLVSKLLPTTMNRLFKLNNDSHYSLRQMSQFSSFWKGYSITGRRVLLTLVQK